MRGVIQEARPSKSGKSLGVKINGQWLTTKSWELQDHVGKEIVGETEDSTYNGQTMTWLNKYTLVDANAAPVQSKAPADKDRSILMQCLAKATLSPDMENHDIEARVAFLWDLAGRVGQEKKSRVRDEQLSEPLKDPEFNDDIPW